MPLKLASNMGVSCSSTGATNTGASTSPTVQVAPVLATMVLVAQCSMAHVI